MYTHAFLSKTLIIIQRRTRKYSSFWPTLMVQIKNLEAKAGENPLSLPRVSLDSVGARRKSEDIY